MKLRYLILLLLAAFCFPTWTLAQACAPPNYCATVERIPFAEPVWPAAADTKATPWINEFGLWQSRLTDGNTCPAKAGKSITMFGSAEINAVSIDGAWFLARIDPTGSDVVVPFSYDNTLMSAATITGSSSGPYCQSGKLDFGVQMRTAEMSRHTAGLVFGQITATSMRFRKFQLPSGGYVDMFCTNGRVASCDSTMTGVGSGADVSTSDDERLLSALYPAGAIQDLWQVVVACDQTLGCRFYNVFTGAIWNGDTGTNWTGYPVGTTANAVRAKIHNARISSDGKYAIISAANCSASCTNLKYIVWQIETTNVYSILSTQAPGGHRDSGYTGIYGVDPTTTGDGRHGIAKIAFSDLAAHSTDLFTTYPTPTRANTEGYISNAYANAGDTHPLGVTYYRISSGLTLTWLDNIIGAAKTDGSGDVYQFAKPCGTTGGGFTATDPRAIFFPDGNALLWNSNGALCARNQGRYDIYVVQASGIPPITPAPTIASISPTSGTYLGGTPVTATGTNFVVGPPSSTLSFDGVQGTSCSAADAQHITCTTPGHAAGVVDVVVTNPDLQTATLAASYTYTGSAALTFTSATATETGAARGSAFGGYTLTIIGTNFAQGATVTLGGFTCGNLTVTGTTTITCTAPTVSAPGAVNIVIRNPDTQSATATNGFTYTKPVIGRP